MNNKETQNRVNHLDNLRHLDGYFYHGTYFVDGVGRPGKKRREKRNKWKHNKELASFMPKDH